MVGFSGKKEGLTVCVLGLGGGGYHAEAEKILSSVRRRLDLILIFSGPNGGLLKWTGIHPVAASYKVRSPLLIGDSYLKGAIGMVKNFFAALKIISKHRPDIIIGVGSIQAVPFFLAGKVLSVKCYYFESITRVKCLSSTGRIISRLGLADRIYSSQDWRE